MPYPIAPRFSLKALFLLGVLLAGSACGPLTEAEMNGASDVSADAVRRRPPVAASPAVAQFNKALAEVPSPASDHPFSRYVNSVRQALRAEGLPVAAPQVRTIVSDNEDEHGGEVARTLAGPIGFAQRSDGHLVMLSTRVDSTGNQKPDSKKIAEEAISSLTLNDATAARLRAAAAMVDATGATLPSIRVTTIADALALALNTAELGVQSRRSELKKVQATIIKGDTSKPTIINHSWGYTHYQVAGLAAKIAILKAIEEPSTPQSLELLEEVAEAIALRGNEMPAVDGPDEEALTMVIAEAMDAKLSDGNHPVNRAKADLAADLAVAGRERVFLVTSAGNDADRLVRINNGFQFAGSDHPQNLAFRGRMKMKWSQNITNSVAGLFVVGSSDVGADPAVIGDESVSNFSSVGQLVLAPGQGVPVGKPAGGVGRPIDVDGTSYASPHLAGVMALMLQANARLTVEQIQSTLRSTAKESYGSPNQALAFGLVVDPVAAVKAAAALP